MLKVQLAILVVGIFLGYAAGNYVGNNKVRNLQYEYTKQQLQQAERYAKELEQREVIQREAMDNATRQTDAAIRAANRSGESAARLRQQLASLQASAKTNAAGSCEAASNSVDLLTDMLGRMEQHGRELAEEADRRGIAGAACEAIVSQ